MEHPLHRLVGKTVGECIDSKKFPDCRIIKDRACGGRQNVPLFCSRKKSNATEYCNVDLLILKDNKIRVIMEIEEANVKPTQIFGKFLTSALSSYFIHELENNRLIGMDDSVLFVQILDTSKLKQDKTSKIEQWKKIQKSIQSIIPVQDRGIGEYRIFFGSSSDFRASGKEKRKLMGCIRKALK